MEGKNKDIGAHNARYGLGDLVRFEDDFGKSHLAVVVSQSLGEDPLYIRVCPCSVNGGFFVRADIVRPARAVGKDEL